MANLTQRHAAERQELQRLCNSLKDVQTIPDLITRLTAAKTFLSVDCVKHMVAALQHYLTETTTATQRNEEYDPCRS